MSVPQKSQNDPVSLEELIGGEGRLIGGAPFRGDSNKQTEQKTKMKITKQLNKQNLLIAYSKGISLHFVFFIFPSDSICITKGTF